MVESNDIGGGFYSDPEISDGNFIALLEETFGLKLWDSEKEIIADTRRRFRNILDYTKGKPFDSESFFSREIEKIKEWRSVIGAYTSARKAFERINPEAKFYKLDFDGRDSERTNYSQYYGLKTMSSMRKFFTERLNRFKAIADFFGEAVIGSQTYLHIGNEKERKIIKNIGKDGKIFFEGEQGAFDFFENRFSPINETN